MRYAIVESGGKQYRAVEGQALDVDRLSAEEGAEINLEKVLFMADSGDVQVGAPTVDGLEVKATIQEHISGRKVVHFRYSPKKRIRVRGGHRAQLTRLMINFIGGKGEVRKRARAPEQETMEPSESPAKAEVKQRVAPAARKSAAKKSAPRRATAGTKPGTKDTGK
jgi:large subunit ribosomal protein L21